MATNADASDDRLYFRQMLSGRDFAVGDPFATQMVNFAYAIGDRSTGECLLVDPAWNVDDLIERVGDDGMRVVGVLATHYHADHVGGSIMGHDIQGVAALLERLSCPVHVQSDEIEWMERTSGVGADHLVAHSPGDVVTVGGVEVKLVHTPGHTPGSQCFLVDGRLVAGDTLFLDGCGRTDLPGSAPVAMAESLRLLPQ
ncbi:MAG: MBL fold metallo-hydrolase, partial [Ilumatobacteraceae bacterium]